MSRLNLSALLVFAGIASSLLVGSSNQAVAQTVVFDTNLGDIQVELSSDAERRGTVANFLAYVNAPAGSNYDGTFIHRSISGFVVQGGGFYTPINGLVASVPQMLPIVNEPGISNTRGTIAMAKIDGDPDSATNQWFFNTVDNSDNLDIQNGGFTVFGTVTSGMNVVDAIEAAPILDIDGDDSTLFNAVPIVIINNNTADFVVVNSVRVVVPGDVNLDGAIDFLDIAPFISVLSTSDFQAEADINLDTNVDFLDISLFIGLLSSQ